MTIEISADLEQRLKDEASRRGVPVEECARQIIESNLPQSKATERGRAMLELFAKWAEDDRTDDPAELERRQTEWEEFRKSMNENSLSGRPVYP